MSSQSLSQLLAEDFHFGNRTNRALNEAYNIASHFHHENIGAGHVIYGIITEPGDVGGTVLSQIFHLNINHLPWVEQLIENIYGSPPCEKPQFSSDVITALKRAHELAIKGGFQFSKEFGKEGLPPNTGHILYAITETQEGKTFLETLFEGNILGQVREQIWPAIRPQVNPASIFRGSVGQAIKVLKELPPDTYITLRQIPSPK